MQWSWKMSTYDDLPSMGALRAFDAALRYLSFTHAAEELGCTQGAVSRQVAHLERQLGRTLFLRQRPRLEVTPEGRLFGERVRAMLDRLAATMIEVRSSTLGGGRLGLAVLPTFGTRWLIPRLRGFYQEHREVRLELATRLGPFDFDLEPDLDAAIHHGRSGGWPGTRMEQLCPEWVTVVCSPEVATGLQGFDDLAKVDRLQLATRAYAWGEWLGAHGVTGIEARRGPRFEHHLMIIQAAVAGLGVALVPCFLVRDELESGLLIEPFKGTQTRSRRAYWLAWPERSSRLPALDSFQQWIRIEIESSGLLAAPKLV
ncbi:MAG: LysR substrate-binding domain-containing protein [Planctomycetota bacterium]